MEPERLNEIERYLCHQREYPIRDYLGGKAFQMIRELIKELRALKKEENCENQMENKS